MNVIIHRGYLGFQPLEVRADISYTFTKPTIESFIDDGVVCIPIGSMDLDQADLGSDGPVLESYQTSNGLYARWLLWDRTGISDHTFLKSENYPKTTSATNPTYTRVVLGITHSFAAVLVPRSNLAEEYLTALVHADATLDQIDAFCQEFYIGSGNPFVWTKIEDIRKLIADSKGKEPVFPYNAVRDGPSRHLMHVV